MAIERIVAFPLIVGAIRGDLFDFTRRASEQIRQDLNVVDIILALTSSAAFHSDSCNKAYQIGNTLNLIS